MDLIDDEIFDIKFFNGQTYLLKTCKISSVDIESAVKALPYSGERLQKDELVEKSLLPPFILAFYKFLFEKNSIPTEDELCEYYLNNYYIVDDNGKCKVKKSAKYYSQDREFNITGIKARLLRSYPSLIRDFHFFQLCTESKYFAKVVYSLNIDYYDGYDLIIDYNSKKYAVALFIKTNRGRFYKNQKINRHSHINDYIEVSLSIDKTTCRKVGNFYLYTAKHVNELLKQLQSQK